MQHSTENPFLFGDVVRGEYFADREIECEELTRNLESGQNVIVYSPRKYGKTSLILKVLDGLERKGINWAYIDLFEITTMKRFIEKFVSEVMKTRKDSEILEILRSFLPRLSPKIVLGEALRVEIGIAKPEKELADVLDLPERMAKKTGRQMVVVFDEFQEVNGLDGDRIESIMRSKFQRHSRVSYVFMGSKRHLFEPIFSERERPFFRFGKQFAVGKLPRDEFAGFIKSRFASTGKSVSDDVIGIVLDMTGCHPHYTQQFCHEIWNVSGKIVAKPDIEKALSRIISGYSQYYDLIWDSLKGHARSLLLGIASGDGSIYGMDFISSHALGTPANVQKALKTLEKKGLIEKTREGPYAVEDLFFSGWLRKRIMR